MSGMALASAMYSSLTALSTLRMDFPSVSMRSARKERRWPASSSEMLRARGFSICLGAVISMVDSASPGIQKRLRGLR